MSRSKTEQAQREADALRANLRRRKQQFQARTAALQEPAPATNRSDRITREN